jgi:hypothetical protein
MVLYNKKLFLIILIITVFTLANHLIIQEISKNELIQNSRVVHINQIKIINPKIIKKNNNTFLKDLIKKNNLKPVLFNQKYSTITSDTLIILIQVHKRFENLKSLLISLSNVKFINETLIILSHDYYNETINQYIKQIKFAPFMQIFYPFMLQLYRFVFIKPY